MESAIFPKKNCSSVSLLRDTDSKETLTYLEQEGIIPIETKAGKGSLPAFPVPPQPSAMSESVGTEEV